MAGGLFDFRFLSFDPLDIYFFLPDISSTNMVDVVSSSHHLVVLGMKELLEWGL